MVAFGLGLMVVSSLEEVSCESMSSTAFIYELLEINIKRVFSILLLFVRMTMILVRMSSTVSVPRVRSRCVQRYLCCLC
jgi:hypothetical protein